MAVAYNYSNVAIANTLGSPGGLSSGSSTMFCTTTPSGYPQVFPFKLRLEPSTANEEVVKVTGGSGTSGSPWTIVRGWDGTVARSHAQTTSAVAHGMTAEDFSLSRTHENSGSGSGVHGLPAAAWATATMAVINETLLANSTTSVVTWASIPQTYAHLLVFVQGRLTTNSAQDGDAIATINGDSAARYSALEIGAGTETGTLNGPWTNSYSSQTAWNHFITLSAAQAGSSVNAGGGFMILPNYAGTSLNKGAYGISGFGNGNNSAMVGKTRWCAYNPTSQTGISTLTLSASAGNFQSGSFFGLYGLA